MSWSRRSAKRVVALVKLSCFGLKMIVNNVTVSPVYALWCITMCAEHVSWGYKNLFGNKISVHLRNSSFGFTAMN